MSLDHLAECDLDNELVVSDRAMATRITLRVPLVGRDAGFAARAERACVQATDVFKEVDRTCTRFDTQSALMQANASPTKWHEVPEPLFLAIREAKRAYDETSARFDPRILRRLVALGYDKTLPFGIQDVQVEGTTEDVNAADLGRWRPRFRDATREVVIGPAPIELGGVGKGLAVRWARDALASVTPDFLVEAGGDVYCAGSGADGEAWSIGVEDPASPSELLATLSVRDRAVTTSSIRLRRWMADGTRVHHLIDPSTGRPGGRGLVSVTVVGKDAARAEVWSKALFLSGRSGIIALAKRRSIPALWVDEAGRYAMTTPMEQYVRWQRP